MTDQRIICYHKRKKAGCKMEKDKIRISNFKLQGNKLLGLSFVFLGSTIAAPNIIKTCVENPNPFLSYGSIAIGSALIAVCATAFACNRYHLKKEKEKQHIKK